jgi:hypothetical protein
MAGHRRPPSDHEQWCDEISAEPSCRRACLPGLFSKPASIRIHSPVNPMLTIIVNNSLSSVIWPRNSGAGTHSYASSRVCNHLLYPVDRSNLVLERSARCSDGRWRPNRACLVLCDGCVARHAGGELRAARGKKTRKLSVNDRGPCRASVPRAAFLYFRKHNMRSLGVHSLVVTCELCHHGVVLPADERSGTVRACPSPAWSAPRCRIVGADARPTGTR